LLVLVDEALLFHFDHINFETGNDARTRTRVIAMSRSFPRAVIAANSSSAEDDLDDRIRHVVELFQTPFSKRTSTPRTATSMTPSPMMSPSSFIDVQKGYLDKQDQILDQKILFRDITPSGSRKARTSSRTSSTSSRRRHRLSQELLLDDNLPKMLGINRRGSSARSSPCNSESSSDETNSPTSTLSSSSSSYSSVKSKTSISWIWGWTFLGLVLLSTTGILVLTPDESTQYELVRPELPKSAGGLRPQGHRDFGKSKSKSPATTKPKGTPPKEISKKDSGSMKPKEKQKNIELAVHLPARNHEIKRRFEEQEPALYFPHPSTQMMSGLYTPQPSNQKRIFSLDPSVEIAKRKVKVYPADHTDNTQFYGILDSNDERLSKMEIREPYSDGECVPMQDWQTTFYPSCNGMHEIAVESLGEDNGNSVNLFGTKGFWRNAWKVDVEHSETMVLKTLKYRHNFEDAHYEHDRVDAVAMERLTSSPHVINVFGFCGHSVLTEYADGKRVGELADKAKKRPLARLKIAKDIATGLADVHGIDGDNNATFVHLDVNPANVVSVSGTLKLNDFNIGIIRRWNTTSNQPCGFPAQYPNPQWRSPEEARDEQNLTEKVDVFSMGHIFFRLICGHEPWNKLEPGGRPSKEEVNRRVRRGDLPFIPDHVINSENPEVIAIRDAMLACYTFDPLERPSAREIVKMLDAALASLTETTNPSKVE